MYACMYVITLYFWHIKTNKNMKTLQKTIQGKATGHDANLIIEWECPITGKQMQCQGEFNFDEEGYWHDVFDADDNYLYTVIAN